MWRDDVIEALISTDPDKVFVEKARLIKQINLPKSIFKLRTVSKYSLEALHNDTIWLSGADEFNDPFDSAHSINPAMFLTRDHVIEALSASGAFSSLPDDDKAAVRASDEPFLALFKIVTRGKSLPISDDEVMNFMRKESTALLTTKFRNTVKKIQRAIKVCCFTTRNDSVVMWSHYANYHKGFSIEYDLAANIDSELALQLWPVIYRAELFDATPHHLRGIAGKPFNTLIGFVGALHKSPEWKYEDEWRIALPLGWSEPSRSMAVPAPKAVYLGARASEEDKARIIAIARQKSVPVYQMSLSSTSFSLEARIVTGS